MSQLILWKNKELSKLKKDMDQLFDRCWSEAGIHLFLGSLAETRAIKKSITDDTFVVRAELGNVDKKDLNITVAHDTLTIQGTRREKSANTGGFYHRIEGKLRTFTRHIPLPFKVEVDEIRARFTNGVLTIVAPRQRPEKVRRIKIEVNESMAEETENA
ncbi:MAG: Hsp20/alpha crystallin family protein [Desulfatiglandaceae bacterium]